MIKYKPMHLLNAKRLADELRQDTVSEAQKYHYTLASLALKLLFGTGSVLTARPTYAYLVGTLLTALISFGGLRACFKVNEAGDNRRFLDRYLCLSVPLLIWSYLFYVLLFYADYFAARLIWGRVVNRLFVGTTPVTLLMSSAMLTVYFAALCHFMRKTSLQ